MKLLIMSDSHGAYRNLKKAIELHPDVDLIVHLGDGEKELFILLQVHPEYREKLCCLCGNCDYGGMLPDLMHQQLVMDLPYGHRLFACHGDFYSVKYGTNRLEYEASRCDADIVLYGHTHVRDNRYEDGRYILNPGSLSCPRDGGPNSYALIDVTEQGIMTNLMCLT